MKKHIIASLVLSLFATASIPDAMGVEGFYSKSRNPMSNDNLICVLNIFKGKDKPLELSEADYKMFKNKGCFFTPTIQPNNSIALENIANIGGIDLLLNYYFNKFGEEIFSITIKNETKEYHDMETLLESVQSYIPSEKQIIIPNIKALFNKISKRYKQGRNNELKIFQDIRVVINKTKNFNPDTLEENVAHQFSIAFHYPNIMQGFITNFIKEWNSEEVAQYINEYKNPQLQKQQNIGKLLVFHTYNITDLNFDSRAQETKSIMEDKYEQNIITLYHGQDEKQLMQQRRAPKKTVIQFSIINILTPANIKKDLGVNNTAQMLWPKFWQTYKDVIAPKIKDQSFIETTIAEYINLSAKENNGYDPFNLCNVLSVFYAETEGGKWNIYIHNNSGE